MRGYHLDIRIIPFFKVLHEAASLYRGSTLTAIAFSASKSKVSVVLDPYSICSQFGRLGLLKTRSKALTGREFGGTAWAIQTRKEHETCDAGRWFAGGRTWTLSDLMNGTLQLFEWRGRGRRANFAAFVLRGSERWSHADAAFRCWVSCDSHGVLVVSVRQWSSDKK